MKGLQGNGVLLQTDVVKAPVDVETRVSGELFSASARRNYDILGMFALFAVVPATLYIHILGIVTPAPPFLVPNPVLLSTTSSVTFLHTRHIFYAYLVFWLLYICRCLSKASKRQLQTGDARNALGASPPARPQQGRATRLYQ